MLFFFCMLHIDYVPLSNDCYLAFISTVNASHTKADKRVKAGTKKICTIVGMMLSWLQKSIHRAAKTSGTHTYVDRLQQWCRRWRRPATENIQSHRVRSFDQIRDILKWQIDWYFRYILHGFVYHAIEQMASLSIWFLNAAVSRAVRVQMAKFSGFSEKWNEHAALWYWNCGAQGALHLIRDTADEDEGERDEETKEKSAVDYVIRKLEPINLNDNIFLIKHWVVKKLNGFSGRFKINYESIRIVFVCFFLFYFLYTKCGSVLLINLMYRMSVQSLNPVRLYFLFIRLSFSH